MKISINASNNVGAILLPAPGSCSPCSHHIPHWSSVSDRLTAGQPIAFLQGARWTFYEISDLSDLPPTPILAAGKPNHLAIEIGDSCSWGSSIHRSAAAEYLDENICVGKRYALST
jgi:hypothetical protein